MISPKALICGSAIFLAVITAATPNECPQFCVCVDTHNGHPNHAKCSSLEGLKTEGKYVPISALDLSNANISKISNHLEKFRNLSYVDLSKNALSEVGKLGRRIKQLYLSQNKITSGKLSKIPKHVEHLDLSYNEITYLPLDLMKLKSLRSIELTGNPINCTCETLEVRNWLQENHVWTDNHIKCSYPIEVKGQPWLQVKQSAICQDFAPRSIPLKQESNMDDENDLMLGDQPVVQEEGSGQIESEDELGKDYLPVEDKKDKKIDDATELINENEGSGDLFEETHLEMNQATTAATSVVASVDEIDRIHDPEVGSGGNELEEDEQGKLINYDDEGSGSGMGFIIPNTIKIDEDEKTGVADDFVEHANEDELNNAPIAPPLEHSTPSSHADSDIAPPEVVEEVIVPSKVSETEQAKPADEVDIGKIDPEQKSNIVAAGTTGDEPAQANSGEGKSTYILLGVVLLLLVVLILFVAIKRHRINRRNRRDQDAENPRSTELVDMNKKNLGKPINKNGNAEHAPLIGDRTKDDFAKPINGEKKTPYKTNEANDNKLQEPLLKKLEGHDEPEYPTKPQQESNNNETQQNRPQEQTPVPAARRQQQPNSTEPIHHYPNTQQTLPPNSDDEVFLPSESSPSSPKPSRYSPVYSPETGRVKIKLTETTKPKTPLLITRSRSNAGEVIITPNGNSSLRT